MKRMYANEELVKLIQENAPEVEVDDTLSNTSENPVQNKVIYGALEDKQDALPDITGETGKFLKVGADGLEWAEGGSGGETKYLHKITLTYASASSSFIFWIYMLSSSNQVFTSITPLASYLYNKGYTSSSNGMRIEISRFPHLNENQISYWTSTRLYSPNGTSVSFNYTNNNISFGLDGSTITLTKSTNTNQTASATFIEDSVIEEVQ